MLKTVKFRLLFAFGVLVYLFISINVLLIKPVDSSSVITENLHLRSVTRILPQRGDLNYDLYVTENNEHYKVGADWAGCFLYNDFISKVKPGQLIKLSIKRHNGLLSSDLKLVVSMVVDGQNYLDSNCVNQENLHEQIYVPIVGIFCLIVIYCLFYNQELKDSKIKRKKKPKAHQIN